MAWKDVPIKNIYGVDDFIENGTATIDNTKIVLVT